MAKWLILQQTCSETPGNITKWIKEYGHEYVTIELWRETIPQSIEHYDGLILMGGTMSANDVIRYPFLHDEIRLIDSWLKMDRPLIGICLGAQLIAKTLGEKIYRGKTPEIGWYPIQFTKEACSDPLFKDLDCEQMVFQWHYDTFNLPERVVHHASSSQCKNQAFRFGEKTYAVQFHPEMDENLVKNWVETNHHLLVELDSYLPHKIITETKTYLPSSEMLGRKMIQNLCEMTF